MLLSSADAVQALALKYNPDYLRHRGEYAGRRRKRSRAARIGFVDKVYLRIQREDGSREVESYILRRGDAVPTPSHADLAGWEHVPQIPWPRGDFFVSLGAVGTGFFGDVVADTPVYRIVDGHAILVPPDRVAQGRDGVFAIAPEGEIEPTYREEEEKIGLTGMRLVRPGKEPLTPLWGPLDHYSWPGSRLYQSMLIGPDLYGLRRGGMAEPRLGDLGDIFLTEPAWRAYQRWAGCAPADAQRGLRALLAQAVLEEDATVSSPGRFSYRSEDVVLSARVERRGGDQLNVRSLDVRAQHG